MDLSFFQRAENLLGEDTMQRLSSVRIVLMGVGGVGSWCAEGLIRTGLKHLVIVDCDNVEPSKESQINKVRNLISIISNYDEIYCSYIPNGKFKFSFEELNEALKDVEFNFPILLIESKEKDIFDVKHSKLGFRAFSIDYLFTSIFALLMTFGVAVGTYQIFNKQTVAAFLLVLAFVFFGVLAYSIYSVIYKQTKEVNKGLWRRDDDWKTKRINELVDHYTFKWMDEQHLPENEEELRQFADYIVSMMFLIADANDGKLL